MDWFYSLCIICGLFSSDDVGGGQKVESAMQTVDQSCDQLSGFSGQVYQSLRRMPNEWKSDSYVLTHSSGVGIWVANGATNMTLRNGSYDHPDWQNDSNNGSLAQRCAYGAYLEWRRAYGQSPDLSVGK